MNDKRKRRERSSRQAKPRTLPGWRIFERLVARIEESLAGKGAVVKSPDRVRDLFTGKLREVDASIRYQLGADPVLITVECRRRNRVQDDVWIEQIAKKREKVGAAYTIAVSSKGFSASARRTAELSNVRLRMLTEISPQEIISWCEVEFLHYMPPAFNLKEVHFFDCSDQWISGDSVEDAVHLMVKEKGSRAPILQCEGPSITPEDMLRGWQTEFANTEQDLPFGVEFDGLPIKKAVHFPIEKNKYWIQTKDGRCHVGRIMLMLEVRRRWQLIPINQIYRYQTPEYGIVDGVEYIIPEFDPSTLAPLRVLLQKGEVFGFKATLALEEKMIPSENPIEEIRGESDAL